jgi:spermidine synthase
MKVQVYQRLLSYLYPVRIRKASTAENPVLELSLFWNQFQLSTDDALYSDGLRYRPMLVALNELDEMLPNVKKVLLLGTGLASAVRIISAKGYYPEYTLVDIDKEVLDWAMQSLPQELHQYLTPVCANATEFVDKSEEQYDLVLVDIFKGMEMPRFVKTRAFLEKCRNRLKAGGHLALNYITKGDWEWNDIRQKLNAVFPENRVVRDGINHIVIS